MRIVFSRKGVDSAAGRIPSPIIDGRLVSLPIPASDKITYGDLKFRGISLGRVVEDLSRHKRKPLLPNRHIHLDPDLRRDAYPRMRGWRPIFGQGEQGSESHLQACGVTVGDLFLFYGWFKEAERRADGKVHPLQTQ